MGYKMFFSVLAVGLSIVQLINSQGKGLVFQSEMDKVEMIERMNVYPPKFFRMAHILEERPESLVFYRIQKNLFSILYIEKMFIGLVVIELIGFFEVIKKGHLKWLVPILVIPILVLTWLGPDQRGGNYCLYPFIIFACGYGIKTIIGK